MRSSWTIAVLASLAGLALFGRAEAGLIPTGVTITPHNGHFRWTYTLEVTADTKVNSWDYFTIHRFGGLLMGDAVVPPDWGVYALFVPGSNAFPDLQAVYYNPAGIPITGPQTILFSIQDMFDGQAFSDLTSQSHRQADGSLETNSMPIIVPFVPQTPEPSTLAMFGIGLPLLGVLRYMRRRVAAMKQIVLDEAKGWL